MFGRIFESMYEGSMVGSGSAVFAVMGYVIANMRPDDVVGAQVTINPKLLAVAIGESEETIQKAIDYLCSPDKQTTTPGADGRRLVKLGSFAYRVVNGAKYMAIKKTEDQREGARLRKALERERAAGNVEPAPAQEQVKPERGVEIPKVLETEAFRKVWAMWLQHQKERSRKVMGATAMRQQLKKCEAMGEARAIAALEHSIAGNYQGLFEPGQNVATHSGDAPANETAEQKRARILAEANQ